MSMEFIKQVINLWRMQKNPTAYEKGILCHLKAAPSVRDKVNRFHQATFDKYNSGKRDKINAT